MREEVLLEFFGFEAAVHAVEDGGLVFGENEKKFVVVCLGDLV